MRRTIVLMMMLLLLLTGCGKKETQKPSAPISEKETTQNTPSSPMKQVPMVAISLTVEKQTHKAEDETVLLNEIYQNISLITPDPAVANNVILDYYQKTDMSSEVDAMKTRAEDVYTEMPEIFHAYHSQVTYKPMRIDQGVLSLFGAYASYTGGVHGGAIGRSATYDLITSRLLTLEDILFENPDADKLYALTLNALSHRDDLFDGYETTVKDRFGKNFLQDKDWYLSNSGLCFFFSPYEIGPYSAGIISAEIPYSQLAGVLDNAYFPAEREQTEGAVEISAFNENALAQYSQFAEVVLKEGSDKILLHSDMGVYDIQIESGSWSSDGATFTPEYTVFACYALTQSDAIMVDAPLTKTLPSLRVSYTTDGQTVTYFIVGDGQSVSLKQIP